MFDVLGFALIQVPELLKKFLEYIGKSTNSPQTINSAQLNRKGEYEL